MISQGRFEHIGRASIRLEGATAWSVWLRIDGGHVANRTVTFHGVARDAARLLVLLFEGWTLPSRVDEVARVEPVFHGEQSSHSVASPLPPPSLQPPASIDESRSLRNMVHQLIDVCRANQSHLTGLREEVATLRSFVNTLVARPHTPSPFRSPCQSGGCWSSARSSSVECQADWTPAPCAVLSRSLHQPKMQCSCTTNQMSGHGPRRVFEWILR